MHVFTKNQFQIFTNFFAQLEQVLQVLFVCFYLFLATKAKNMFFNILEIHFKLNIW